MSVVPVNHLRSQVHDRSSRLLAQLQATPKGRTLVLEGGGTSTLVDLMHSPSQRSRINATLVLGLFGFIHPVETANVCVVWWHWRVGETGCTVHQTDTATSECSVTLLTTQ